MIKKTIQTLLKSSFQNSTVENWKQAAIAEIKESNPLEHLKWKTADNINFYPIYIKKDLTELKYLNAFDFKPSNNNDDARSWLNLPSVIIFDDLTANKIALDHLVSSADGIFFNLQNKDFDLFKLLHTIEWPYCNISFNISSSEKFTETLNAYIKHHKFTADQLTGALFWHNWPEDIYDLSALLNNQNKIHYLGIYVHQSAPVTEIADALTKAVSLLDFATDKGVPLEKAINSIAFSIPVGTNIFVEIAKLKALRMLWFQITKAYQVKNYTTSDLHIHTRSEVYSMEKMQPHGNMLKTTTSALASVMGGCDALTIYVEDDNNKMMNRIARNVSNILREESHFSKVADPAAGSYLIENMTDEIAKKAWQQFNAAIIT